MAVLHVSELDLSLGQFEHTDLDIVLVEASGIARDDIDLCYRLRQRFDIPLMLITKNVTEDFAVAAYKAGVDECISGHISTDLLRAKVGACIRWIERVRRQPESEPPSHAVGHRALRMTANGAQ